MKKLRLDVETLDIEQFQTEALSATDGTVVARSDTLDAYTAPCRFCPDMPLTFTCA
jgi:hypothetical protein